MPRSSIEILSRSNVLSVGSQQFVLDAQQMRLLDGLRLNPRKSFAGRIRGERLTKKKGISIEFADFRDYSDGDDLRHLDWNVLARLDNPVIRTYQDEEDLAVHVVVDCSTSMDFGSPTKLERAQEVAGVFGYIALTAGDALLPRPLGKRDKSLPALHGRASFLRFASWIKGLKADGTIPLAKSLREFASASVRTGIVVLISDGLDADFMSALRILSGRGHEVWMVQVLADEEIDPDLEGDLRLIDAEGGGPVEITANSMALTAYKQNFEAHCAAISAELQRLGGRYARLRTSGSLDDLVKDTFKRYGWLTG